MLSSVFTYFTMSFNYLLNHSISIFKNFNLKSILKIPYPMIFNLNKLICVRRIAYSSVIYEKRFQDIENAHSYSVLNKYFKSKHLFNDVDVYNEKKYTDLEIIGILNKNLRLETPSKIAEIFTIASEYAERHNIPISDHIFDNLVDGLLDNCENLADVELHIVLKELQRFPQTETIHSHNFKDVWNCLDFICRSRVREWPIEKLLFFVDHWHKLYLARIVDFTYGALSKICRKPSRLSKEQLVQTLFYIGICRKSWPDMFEYEFCILKYFDDLSIDEIAIFAMSFFKTQTPIKDPALLRKVIDKVIANKSTVNEISLSAILKIIRFSPHLQVIDEVTRLVEGLESEIDRLSLLCCTHIALAGTPSQVLCEKTLQKLAEKFVKNIKSARLKDMERIIFTLSLFDFNPKTSRCIFEAVAAEIQELQRTEEIEKHPKCLACLLHFLGLRKMYVFNMISRCLDSDFIRTVYGTNMRQVGREILFLDTSLAIECPEYQGNKLKPKLRESLAKFQTEWAPSRNQTKKLTKADILMLEIEESLQRIQSPNGDVLTLHVLPHFQRADMIVCFYEGKAVKVPDLSNYSLGDVKYPVDNSLTWLAIVIGGWNAYVRGTNNPLGVTQTKIRQLKKIGYKPVLVHWKEFMELDEKQKDVFMKEEIKKHL